MSKLAITDWPQNRREVEFIGWTNPERTAGFIRDTHSEPRVLRLWLPKFFGIQFCDKAVPPSPPTQIIRTALRLPPCCASKRDAEAASAEAAQIESVAAHLGCQESIVRPFPALWLEGRHDKKLKELLRKTHQRFRAAYQQRQDEIAQFPPNSGSRQSALKLLRRDFSTWYEIIEEEGVRRKRVRVADVTLDMVRHGALGLREQLLWNEWADKHGLDIEAVETDRIDFHSWLEEHAVNARFNIADFRSRTRRQENRLSLMPDQWALLETAIRYEVRWADSDARIWLIDLTEEPVTEPKDVDNLAVLEQSSLDGAKLITRDEARRSLSEDPSDPITEKWLRVLCQRAGVKFSFPMGYRDFKKVRRRQMRQRQARAAKAKANLPIRTGARLP